MGINDLFTGLRRRLRRPRYPVVLNANRVDERSYRKRALLVYLPRAFVLDDDDPAFALHTNLHSCQTMAAILDEFGYVVDVANRRDERFRPRPDYDLVIGEKFDWGRNRFRPDTLHAFLATSMDHAVHNANVRRRHAEHLARGRAPVVQRRVYPEYLPAVWSAHALIGIGNDFTVGTWKQGFAGPTFGFNNVRLRQGAVSSAPRDLATAGRHFLFHASGSQMQKGLGLLLEIFPRHPQLHLWVCSGFEGEADFCAAYRQELFETPNIHPLGWTSAASPQFASLLRTCAFVIHPSCSEGQAGSVVHPMHSGLIPLVTRETGLDTDDFGITFARDAIGEIEGVVLDMARRPPSWLEEHAERTRRAASERFSEEAFARRWRSILSEITRLPG